VRKSTLSAVLALLLQFVSVHWFISDYLHKAVLEKIHPSSRQRGRFKVTTRNCLKQISRRKKHWLRALMVA
jgi:hypothetical protein